MLGGSRGARDRTFATGPLRRVVGTARAQSRPPRASRRCALRVAARFTSPRASRCRARVDGVAQIIHRCAATRSAASDRRGRGSGSGGAGSGRTGGRSATPPPDAVPRNLDRPRGSIASLTGHPSAPLHLPPTSLALWLAQPPAKPALRFPAPPSDSRTDASAVAPSAATWHSRGRARARRIGGAKGAARPRSAIDTKSVVRSEGYIGERREGEAEGGAREGRAWADKEMGSCGVRDAAEWSGALVTRSGRFGKSRPRRRRRAGGFGCGATCSGPWWR